MTPNHAAAERSEEAEVATTARPAASPEVERASRLDADPLEVAAEGAGERRRYVLEDTGFDEVPKNYRRFYRKWRGPGDSLAPNEVICPVCKVVIRSTRELRPGDRVFCMPCMSRLTVVRGASGMLEAHPVH